MIVSTIITDNALSDSRRELFYQFTDHLGKAHNTCPKLVPSDFDAIADQAAQIIYVESKLAFLENVAAEDATDVLSFILNPEHSTSKRIVKYLIRKMMKERDPYLVLKLEALIDYLRTNYTAAQLRNFLDVTAAQLTRMNQKINAVLASKADLETADIQEEF